MSDEVGAAFKALSESVAAAGEAVSRRMAEVAREINRSMEAERKRREKQRRDTADKVASD